jgi:transposase-like protein
MQVTSNGRVRRSEAEWSEILRRFADSGLSRAEFCRREGLIASSFKRWQRKLETVALARFVEITPSVPTSCESWEVEVSLPNGTRLQFRG